MTYALQEFFAPPSQEVQLRNDLIAMIMARHTSTPRHLQVELGPSEIGHPCSRHLAYAIANDPVPRCNPQWDPLPSIIGVAVHTWLQSAAELANTELGRDRWLAETKVYPADWLTGHCDLFDVDTGTVIDWKVPGVNQFGILKREMSLIYQAQAHMYGRGFERAGFGVNKVAIMLLPRGGTLSSAHLWSEDYDRTLANEAMSRRGQIAERLKIFDVNNHPERFEWFEKKAYHCMFCPWFSPKPNGPLQCSGDGLSPPTP